MTLFRFTRITTEGQTIAVRSIDGAVEVFLEARRTYTMGFR